ncbi:UDP-N-acetylenolpyruvoylglucosamine reductase [Candidatus Uhrbacteria bacterium CG_4_9_14_0_2_um_filter_41_50]|uniref:UDP-N-acetylenolpyruvoylglucosamine reductase n=1 Tax=Candidatus Uhrbacteria bacterium CG_4_9_14_0_2_um_filter_41_50 TaxID=1975031 RepID=A0A2M8EPB8_9BACT|nr:MAG: UDP-N-acetylenolpyruvoylglucosamine reductase [Candidatus Uhrbacteria bacterium CG_4_10_14_3_um_filter_41_21]PIZ54618.1 MAG: UDP-N-acetylenolpyruvoylglucosamine reductase [Candidatus Uhrbacteria bacterium CG_4_10_14_0_2_um_filter_41_21]PJB84259.1 MAG: UDP-N-acetylenolpyruvoylglucosamine reductase [Candidatus Uhrbacteria bacterium CG_4_9_14_0_8_um_filter_41_16]PJC24586.1 MAG: UDP-N-acetylenolpyruvoylglucosamine reductase [Candidatus Uhrbacteria bacterium CG_4_9_14_0_2_um_filter_41_50]PJE
MTNITQELQDIFGEQMRENEPLSKHTNFRVGGPAKWFCEVDSADELIKAINVLSGQVTYFILGGGSNVLASDEGFLGVVFKLTMRNIEISGTTVKAGAGALAVMLARTTVGAGLAGLEWAVSLPGTVGGMVRGNAGCFGGETKDNLKSIEVLSDGKIKTMQSEELNFGYRHSAIKKSTDIVLTATFQLKVGDKDQLKARMNEILEKRKTSQPLTSGTAGCTFKNYETHKGDDMKMFAELGIPKEMLDARRISSGWLIDRAELKGEKIGGASVSLEHGNFIINDGSATADQIFQLISLVKTRVRDKFNIELEEEIQYLGL